jgi:CheY-like chemotaxis protein
MVLIVDDDYDIRAAISEALALHGYRVGGAADGKEALDRLRAGLRPSLILLDLMMPGMNGWEFREAQARDAELAKIPVVLLTGDGGADAESAGEGADGFLRKPFALERLLETVERFCARPSETSSNG